MPTNYNQMELVSVAMKVQITAKEKRLADELVSRNPTFMDMGITEEFAESVAPSEIHCDRFVIVISRDEQLIVDQILDRQGSTQSRRVPIRKKKSRSAVKDKLNESLLLPLDEEPMLTLTTEAKKASENGSNKSGSYGSSVEEREASVTDNDNYTNEAVEQPPVKLTLRLGRKKLATGVDGGSHSPADGEEQWTVRPSTTEESRPSASKRPRRSAPKRRWPEFESESNIPSSSVVKSSRDNIGAPTWTLDAKKTPHPQRPPLRYELAIIPWAYPLHAFVVLKKDIRTNPDRPRYIYRVCEDKLKRYNRIADGYQIDFLDVEGYENIMLEDQVQSNPELFEPIDVMDSEAITVHLKKRVTSSDLSSIDLRTSSAVVDAEETEIA